MSKKYYKAFDRDLTCRGFQYQEGEVYEIDEEPILCEKGFHFCQSLVLTLQYYPVEKITDNKYAEVDVLGDTKFEEPTKHKGITNKIKIVRVLSDEEVLDLVDGRNNSGKQNSGNGNSGNGNSGHWNSGHWNSGDRNSGRWNSGYGNSGDSNSGHWNSGHWNSGDSNSGHWNSGHWNSGDRNSGRWNSGHWNSGDWNSCDKEAGFFNTEQPDTVRIFNKPCPIEDWENADKPGFIYFDLDPELGYKGSWQKAFEEASDEDIERLKALPNFDADVFAELTGIEV